MKSPPSFDVPPKVIKNTSEIREDDSHSIASASSRNTTSTRESRLPKFAIRKSSTSFTGGWNYGNGGDANIRVVCRIRPSSEPASGEGSRIVLLDHGEEKINSSPKKSKTGRESNDSFGSVANLTAMFNSPNNKVLMPCTDSFTNSVTPTKLFSPPNNTSKTPIHTNKNSGKIVPVRQSFIQSPSTTKEIEEIIEKRAAGNNNLTQTVIVGTAAFELDAVTDTTATQEEVYHASVGDALRRNIFRGFNTTIMTFGQRNTGKSYTMFGPKMKKHKLASDDDSASIKTADSYNTAHGSYDDDGIVPRAIYDLFMAKEKQATGGEVVIQMTFIEIYNDSVVDLLTHKKNKGSKVLTIRDDVLDGKSGGVTIRGLTSIKLKSTSHARHIINAASKRRSSASRSHTICTLHVKINPAVNSKVTSGKLASMTSVDIIAAKLILVDLAGSERPRGETSAEGQKEKTENSFISKDLFVLGQCITSLSGNREKSNTQINKTKHIPFRDCKLTRILRNSLGGNCYTVMIACVAPCSKDVEGSLSTMRVAERSRKIVSCIKKNLIKLNSLTPAEGAALRKENKVLKSHVLDMTRRIQNFRRGPQRNRVVVDIEGFQDGSVHESLETKRWRLKFEKLLTACREENMKSDKIVKLTDYDENILMSHSLEVQELKEQINHLMSCQLGDCASVTSGITMDTHDFDDFSISSATKSTEVFSCIDSRVISIDPSSEKETIEKMHPGEKQLDKQIEIANVELNGLKSQENLIGEKVKAAGVRLRKMELEERELNEKILAAKALLNETQMEDKRLDERTKAIEAELTELETKKKALNDQIDLKKAELAKMKIESKEVDERINLSKARLEQLEHDIKVLIGQEERLKDTVSTHDKNLQTINSEVEESELRREALRRESNELSRQVTDAQELVEFSNDTIEEKVAECDRINSDIISMKEEVRVLTVKKRSLATEVDDLKENQADFEQINSQLNSLREEVNMMCTQRDSLANEVSGFNSISQVLSDLSVEKKTMKEVQKLLESATNEVSSLRSKLDEVERKLQLQTNRLEREREKRLATEEQVASLELRLLVEDMKDHESKGLDQSLLSLKSNNDVPDDKFQMQLEATELEAAKRVTAEENLSRAEERLQEVIKENNAKISAMALQCEEVESMKSSIHSLNRQLQEQSEACNVEKASRCVAEEKVISLEKRIQELLEEKNSREDTECPDSKQENLELRVSELENLIKMQLNQKQENLNTRRLLLRDQSNEPSKPPLAKKRKNAPIRSFGAPSPNMIKRDDRSIISTMSGLLQGSENLGDDDPSSSFILGNSYDSEYSEGFNSSFDNQSFMSGTSFSMGSVSMGSDQRAIRIHAQKLLLWAGKAVQGHADDFSLSFSSDKENMDHISSTGRFQITDSPNSRRSSRSESCTLAEDDSECSCKESIFGGNKEYTDFFLPKLGLTCTCGKGDKKEKTYEDPTALKSFLRSWQVSYLKSVGVLSAYDLITQHGKRKKEIARAMKHWRYSKRMKPARTKACLIALEIWTKTAKTRVKKHGAINRSDKIINPSEFEIAPSQSNDSVSVMSMDEFDGNALYDGEYEI